MSDATRMLSLLREYRDAGLHSHDARSFGISGNPSQRAKDLVDRGHGIYTKRERRGHRQGSRYWLREWAPVDARRVKGNHETDDVEVAGEVPEGVLPARDPGAGNANPLIDRTGAGGGGGIDCEVVRSDPAPSDAGTRPLRLVADYRDRDNPSWYEESIDPRGGRKSVETPELGAETDRRRRIPVGSELGGLGREAAA